MFNVEKFYICNMVRLGSDMWRQDYYGTNFFILQDVIDDECIRLARLGVSVIDYEISIGNKKTQLIFFLHLYFRAVPHRELSYEELFGNNY